MNLQSHHLIFNASRGCMMAVAETSRSCRKSNPSGATNRSRSKRTRSHHYAKIQASNRPLTPVLIAQAATNLVAKVPLIGTITAQIPNTKGGQELKSQINALVTQGNGVGLDYLSALANNPNVKWDKVAQASGKSIGW